MNERFSSSPHPLRRSRVWIAGVYLGLCAVFSGCSTFNPHRAEGTRADRPPNVYLAAAVLPAEVKRVAVLPLVSGPRGNLIEGCAALAPVLNQQLLKTERFETIRITPEELMHCSGRAGWTGQETLPAELFSALSEAYGCDAVLFCELTEFRADAPLAIGWRMKLVDVRTRQILWAGDEVFDATPAVAQDWRHRYWPRLPASYEESRDEWLAQNSPRRFGQITVAQLLATLPAR